MHRLVYSGRKPTSYSTGGFTFFPMSMWAQGAKTSTGCRNALEPRKHSTHSSHKTIMQLEAKEHSRDEKELVQKKGEDKQKTDMYARLERLESQVEEIHNMLNKDKFYCATCEVSLNGAQRYANHMAGKFHENHVKCKIEELQSIGIEDKIDTIHHDQLRIERKLDQVCSTFEQVCFRLDELP